MSKLTNFQTEIKNEEIKGLDDKENQKFYYQVENKVYELEEKHLRFVPFLEAVFKESDLNNKCDLNNNSYDNPVVLNTNIMVSHIFINDYKPKQLNNIIVHDYVYKYIKYWSDQETPEKYITTRTDNSTAPVVYKEDLFNEFDLKFIKDHIKDIYPLLEDDLNKRKSKTLNNEQLANIVDLEGYFNKISTVILLNPLSALADYLHMEGLLNKLLAYIAFQFNKITMLEIDTILQNPGRNFQIMEENAKKQFNEENKEELKPYLESIMKDENSDEIDERDDVQLDNPDDDDFPYIPEDVKEDDDMEHDEKEQ